MTTEQKRVYNEEDYIFLKSLALAASDADAEGISDHMLYWASRGGKRPEIVDQLLPVLAELDDADMEDSIRDFGAMLGGVVIAAEYYEN